MNRALQSTTDVACPACGQGDATSFFRLEDVPVFCNVLWETVAEAQSAATGDIDLWRCPACELVFNAAFDPELVQYAPGYENALHHSPRFQTYADGLAADLVARYDLYEKRVLEIGCGDGDFLRRLCRHGARSGVGYDPSCGGDSSQPPDTRITLIADYFDSAGSHAPADLICCRHVLEHVESPLEFLGDVRRSAAVAPNTIVYFEVPNGLWTLEQGGVWDVLYEHYSYYVSSSLVHLFRSAGFDIQRVAAGFGGQFLGIEAVPGDGDQSRERVPVEETQTNIGQLCSEFAKAFEVARSRQFDKLTRIHDEGRTAVCWGAGTKGVMFCNAVDPLGHLIEAVVDLNPKKHGRFVPRTGHRVIGPELIGSIQPDVILLLNPVYESEIRSKLAQLGVDPELQVVVSDEDCHQAEHRNSAGASKSARVQRSEVGA